MARNGRMLRKFCPECRDWIGESYIPETVPVETSKPYYPFGHGGWKYEMYDEYGNISEVLEF